MQQHVAPCGWAGIDVGKGHHWVCLIDKSGATVWSGKVVNDETAILEAIGEVLARAEQVVWAVGVTGTMSGLLLALLTAHGQQVKYVPRPDDWDAYVIAETVRHRGDRQDVEVSTALVSELRLRVAHRSDLVADRVRIVNRLRDVLSGYLPASERAFDHTHSLGALPQPAAGLLPDHPYRHDARGTQPRLLPQEAQPGPETRPNTHRTGLPPRRRPVGAATRQPGLPDHPTGRLLADTSGSL